MVMNENTGDGYHPSNFRASHKGKMNMSNTSMTATQKLLSYLKTGRDITASQAQSRFGISNVSARVSELRKAGYSVYLNEKVTSNGKTIKAYRLGTPTRRQVAIANFVESNPNFFGKASWIGDRAARLMKTV
jgi:predicted transcriptional regulator